MHTNGFAHSCNNCHDIFSLYANTLQYLAQIVVVDDEIERMLLTNCIGKQSVELAWNMEHS